MKIRDRKIGGEPYIIFEAGATHTGYESCKRLIILAAEAGADAIKCQSVYADDLTWPDDASQVSFGTAAGKRKESVREALLRRELPLQQWVELVHLAHDRGIAFITTPSSIAVATSLLLAGCNAIKIAKGDQNYFTLIGQIAEWVTYYGRAIILDGRERMADVSAALNTCRQNGVEDIAIMHCPSGYPTEEPHLTAIKVMRLAFPDVPIGYADHSLGSSMCHAAVALGASIIEKTITEDSASARVEHYMSLNPNECKPFVEGVREVYRAMGDPAVIFSSRVNKEARRGIYAGRDMKAGETITLSDLAFKRPEYEWSADMADKLIGQTIEEDMAAGDKFGVIV